MDGWIHTVDLLNARSVYTYAYGCSSVTCLMSMTQQSSITVISMYGIVAVRKNGGNEDSAFFFFYVFFSSIINQLLLLAMKTSNLLLWLIRSGVYKTLTVLLIMSVLVSKSALYTFTWKNTSYSLLYQTRRHFRTCTCARICSSSCVHPQSLNKADPASCTTETPTFC